MGKIKAFMFLLVILLGGVAIWKFDMSIMKLQVKELEKPVQTEKEFEKIKERIDDTAILRNAFKSVGILGVLEGEEEYTQLIEEENWYSYRSININWRYRFGLAINLEDITVDANHDIVYINVVKDQIRLWFIEKKEESISGSFASWFAKKYSAQEISMLEKAVLEKVTEKIKSTDAYWTEAEKSLEVNLVKLCNELGYYNLNIKIE